MIDDPTLSQLERKYAVGLTSVHVNRTLMRLEQEGHIRRTRRIIEIDDWQNLAKVADFEPRYLHLGNSATAPAPPPPRR